MTELSTLQKRIASLTQQTDSVSGRYRELLPAGSADGLAAMRLEIEETQLLRRLVFRNDKGDTIGLEVASARVLRMSGATSHKLPAAYNDLMDQDLLDDNQDHIAAIFALLRDFGSTTQKLCVESHILPEQATVSSVGIPASKLFLPSQETAKTLETCADQTGLIDFAEKCASVAMATLAFDETEVSLELGNDELLWTLRNIADAGRDNECDERSTGKSGDQATRCTIISDHPDNGRSLLCADASGSQVFVLFETTALEKVLEIWRDCQV